MQSDDDFYPVDIFKIKSGGCVFEGGGVAEWREFKIVA